MYHGELVDIVLQFEQSLNGAVFDKFGEDTQMMRVNESRLVATIKVQISSVFWGWLFQFAGQMKIISPDGVTKQFQEHLSILEN